MQDGGFLPPNEHVEPEVQGHPRFHAAEPGELDLSPLETSVTHWMASKKTFTYWLMQRILIFLQRLKIP